MCFFVFKYLILLGFNKIWKMGNSSTKLAEKCSLLSKDEIPIVASSFKLVSKNSERIKEDDLMVIKINY